MATILSHGIVGVTSSRLIIRREMPRSFWWLTFFAAMLPDVDGIGLRLGIPYSHCWGHRGAMHSLFIAAVAGVALACGLYLGGALRERGQAVLAAFALFLAIAEHGLVDAMTNGGLGVAFFWPFACQRYFFSWRPIQVSPLSAGRFMGKFMPILRTETLWLLLPCAALLFADAGIRALSRSREKMASRTIAS